MNHFIHFGCWNKGVCRLNGTNAVSRVMNKLHTMQDIDFIVIAGDNYYPVKTKKPKTRTLRINDLQSGFDCLPVGRPVYVLMGNHDVVPDIELTTIQKTPDVVEMGQCTILEQEMSRQEIIFNKSLVIGDTLLLMIDTTIYEEDASVLPCYEKLLGRRLTLDELMEEQQTFVLDRIKETAPAHLIMVGHHPITGKKYKDGSQLIEPSESFLALWRRLADIKIKKYTYLCADLHLYQEGFVKLEVGDKKGIKIHQFIVGTGGADLDPLPYGRMNDYEVATVGVRYKEMASLEWHGFLHVQIEPFETKFVKADHQRKTLRRLRKLSRKTRTVNYSL